MAHGDFVQGVSAEETDLVLTLMREVLADRRPRRPRAVEPAETRSGESTNS
jgi:hypothetical protein